MRQTFDKGDLVTVVHNPNEKGIILESSLVLPLSSQYSDDCLWHFDEYHCKVMFLGSDKVLWVRPKWLKHLSKISQ